MTNIIDTIASADDDAGPQKLVDNLFQLIDAEPDSTESRVFVEVLHAMAALQRRYKIDLDNLQMAAYAGALTASVLEITAASGQAH